MTGGFGYPNYATQKKTPSSQAVGQALLQRGQMAQQQGQPMQQQPMQRSMQPAPGPMGYEGEGPSEGLDRGELGEDDSQMRQTGAGKMGGPGQIDDNAHGDDGVHSANAVNVAVGEALTRMGGGYTTNPNPFKPRDRALKNLQQLGLSETEAMLLIRTGGA